MIGVNTMTAIKPFDINNIEDYQLAIKLNAAVFITEPDSSLSEDFQNFLKNNLIVPDVVYHENGYELYLGTTNDQHYYSPYKLRNSKAEMEIDYDTDWIEHYIDALNDAVADLKSETDGSVKFKAMNNIKTISDKLEAMYGGPHDWCLKF